MFLLPLPKAAARDTEKAQASSSTPKAGAPAPVRPQKKARRSAKAKSLCPQELRGFQQRDPSGNAICWAFNLKAGCKNEVNNGRCKKGVHCCMRFHCCMRCHKANHSLVTCRSN